MPRPSSRRPDAEVPPPSRWCSGHLNQIALPGLACPDGIECDGRKCWDRWEGAEAKKSTTNRRPR